MNVSPPLRPRSKFPEEHYGPSTEFREYSFFNNSRMTPAVRDDRVVVEVCDTAGAAGCSDGSKPAQLVVSSEDTRGRGRGSSTGFQAPIDRRGRGGGEGGQGGKSGGWGKRQ